ncbi:hypothetical protein DFH09DRAFT_1360069 [Mycena vulgaris]|nr:hypothetical protein DFH09DRAFT_1360069 [Mycena vulgaris]
MSLLQPAPKLDTQPPLWPRLTRNPRRCAAIADIAALLARIKVAFAAMERESAELRATFAKLRASSDWERKSLKWDRAVLETERDAARKQAAALRKVVMPDSIERLNSTSPRNNRARISAFADRDHVMPKNPWYTVEPQPSRHRKPSLALALLKPAYSRAYFALVLLPFVLSEAEFCPRIYAPLVLSKAEKVLSAIFFTPTSTTLPDSASASTPQSSSSGLSITRTWAPWTSPSQYPPSPPITVLHTSPPSRIALKSTCVIVVNVLPPADLPNLLQIPKSVLLRRDAGLVRVSFEAIGAPGAATQHKMVLDHARVFSKDYAPYLHEDLTHERTITVTQFFEWILRINNDQDTSRMENDSKFQKYLPKYNQWDVYKREAELYQPVLGSDAERRPDVVSIWKAVLALGARTSADNLADGVPGKLRAFHWMELIAFWEFNHSNVLQLDSSSLSSNRTSASKEGGEKAPSSPQQSQTETESRYTRWPADDDEFQRKACLELGEGEFGGGRSANAMHQLCARIADVRWPTSLPPRFEGQNGCT